MVKISKMITLKWCTYKPDTDKEQVFECYKCKYKDLWNCISLLLSDILQANYDKWQKTQSEDVS